MKTTDTQRLVRRIANLPVAVKVVLGTTTLSLSQVAQLQRGSTVILGQRVTEPVAGTVGRQPILLGHVYAQSGHYAVKIARLLERGERAGLE
jgi:flagellar motor switch protein FliM